MATPSTTLEIGGADEIRTDREKPRNQVLSLSKLDQTYFYHKIMFCFVFDFLLLKGKMTEAPFTFRLRTKGKEEQIPRISK